MGEEASRQDQVVGNRQQMERLLQEAQDDLMSGRASNNAIEKRLQMAADEAGLQVLYRPHLIPHVSPGYEMDIKVKQGTHSSNSSPSRWLEVLGCGLIHDD